MPPLCIFGKSLNSIFKFNPPYPSLKKGTLIIFPSYISHYVLPNKTDKRRATIAANFVITAADKKDE